MPRALPRVPSDLFGSCGSCMLHGLGTCFSNDQPPGWMGQRGREGARQGEMWSEPLLQEQSRRCACPGGADCPCAGVGVGVGGGVGVGVGVGEVKPDNYKMASSGVRWPIRRAPAKLLTPPEAGKAPRWRAGRGCSRKRTAGTEAEPRCSHPGRPGFPGAGGDSATCKGIFGCHSWGGGRGAARCPTVHRTAPETENVPVRG